MKKIITILLLLLTILEVNSQISKNLNTLLGKWRGDFGKKTITIEIQKIADGFIYGKNTVGKTSRKISGSYILKDNGNIYVELNEPGDHKYDGIFKITFLNKNSANGNWRMFKGNSFKKFTIKKIEKQKNGTQNQINSKTNYLIGKWHGLKDRFGSEFFLNIERVTNDSIFGLLKRRELGNEYIFKGAKSKNGNLTLFNIKRVFFNRKENKVYDDWDKAEKNILTYNPENNRLKINPSINLEKYPTNKEKLLEGLIGDWEGEIKVNDSNFIDYSLTVTKIKRDSIFGFTHIEFNEGVRKLNFKGVTTISEDKYSIIPAVSANIILSKDKIVLLDFHFKYLKPQITGTYGGKYNMTLEKPNRIKQSSEKVQLLDSRISYLEKQVKELSNIYDEILHYGRATPYTTIKKAKDKMKFIDKWMKQNPITNNSKLLTREQEKRMQKITEFMIFSSSNSKLVNILRR